MELSTAAGSVCTGPGSFPSEVILCNVTSSVEAALHVLHFSFTRGLRYQDDVIKVVLDVS